jgi:hypothetical protein
VLRVLGWNYASVVHTQTDYGTTGYDALGRRKNNDFQHFQNKVFLYTDSFLSVQYTLDRQKFAIKHSNCIFSANFSVQRASSRAGVCLADPLIIHVRLSYLLIFYFF